MKIFKSKLLPFILLVIFGFTPLLWFSPGMVLSSTDMRLPSNVHKWKQLFYVWNSELGTGAERLLDTCLLIFNGMPAALQKMGAGLILTQKIIFVFWFMLAGFSMYFLLSKLLSTEKPHRQNRYVAAERSSADSKADALQLQQHRKATFSAETKLDKSKLHRYIALTGTAFYLYNLWQTNIWVAFKPPLISAYAVLPLILALMIEYSQKQTNLFKYSCLIAVLTALAGAVGNNPSELLGAVFPVVIFAVYLLGEKIFRKDYKGFFDFTRFIILTALLSCLINLYWILPQAIAIFENVAAGAFMPKNEISLQWLKGLSAHTSFINVIRFQGDWTWYGGCVDPYQAYSDLYRTNPFFIVLGWFLPTLAAFGAVFGKNKYKPMFIITTCVGIILCMGAHSPFEKSYLWLVKNLPLFWIVRSPYFKFGLLLCLGYSVLIALASSRIYEYLSMLKNKCRYLAPVAVAAIFILICVYGFPVVLGRMFHKQAEREFLPPNHIAIPDYVYEAAKWVNDRKPYFRIFNLPGDSPWISSWGYAGYGSVINNFITKPAVFIYDPEYILGSQGAVNMSYDISRAIRDGIYEKKSFNVAKILKLINVDYILQENDVRYDFYKGCGYIEGDDPDFIKNALAYQRNIVHAKVFGEWDFHTAAGQQNHIYGMNKVSAVVKGSVEDLIPLANTSALDESAVIFIDEQSELPFWRDITEKQMLYSIVAGNCGDGEIKDLAKIAGAGANGNSVLWYKFLDTRKMQTDIYKDEKDEQGGSSAGGLKYYFNEGFYDDEDAVEGEAGWKWLKTNMSPHIIIENPDNPRTVNIKFKAYSFGRKRALYTYLNNDLLSVNEIAGDNAAEVMIKGINLKKGSNAISFYNVAEADIKDDKLASFAFFKDVELGRLLYKEKIYLPFSGSWNLKLYPDGNRSVDFEQKDVIINKTLCSLEARQIGGRKIFERTFEINDGSCDLSISQECSENYLVEITSGQSALDTQPPQIKYDKINPTKYVLRIKADKPYVLIFSESYHPKWQAFIDGEKAENHFIANGFANGWYIERISDTAGEYEIILEFAPQRYFERGLIISIAAAAGLLGIGLLKKVLVK